MKIVFCNITYLKFYDGRIAGELKPKTGGRWVAENEDAHEKWNFLNMDGFCYGYVQGNSDQMHIESIDKKAANQDELDDVTVVWCASHPTKGTVVVGWYEHSTVYRYGMDSITTPITGIDRYYYFKTNAEDAYLLPEELRTFEINRAAKSGKGKGFGQSNYWFANTSYAKENIIPKIVNYFEENKESRINVISKDFEKPKNLSPLTDNEMDYANLIEDDENLKYLPYAYRLYENEHTADNAYKVAGTLYNLFQYKKSIPWYEKTVEIDPKDIPTMGILAYVYAQCEEYDNEINMTNKILETGEKFEQDYLDEIYSMRADAYYYKNNIKEAINWQNRIIKESENKDLIAFTKELKAKWEQLL